MKRRRPRRHREGEATLTPHPPDTIHRLFRPSSTGDREEHRWKRQNPLIVSQGARNCDVNMTEKPGVI